jgi:hypothetical protein
MNIQRIVKHWAKTIINSCNYLYQIQITPIKNAQ